MISKLKISINVRRFDTYKQARINKTSNNNKSSSTSKSNTKSNNDKQKAIEKNKAYTAYTSAKNKYEMYKKNLEIINGWKTTVNNVLSDLTSAHASFIDGGYVASGESFHESGYAEMIKMINEDNESLDRLIQKIETRIVELKNDMDNKLTYYNSL